MANMGLSDLAIAAPGKIDMDEARKMACGGDNVLAASREFPSLAEAVADCGLVVGTSARPGLYRCHARMPREIAPRILETYGQTRVALVFGREDRGLTNEELALCNPLIRIPSAVECTSLNVAQAVMICCYEIFSASGLFVPPQEPTEEAPSEVKERMFAMWRATLLRIGFMTEDKADHMMLGIRRILSRGPLTRNDVKIMMGISRQTDWACKQGSGKRSKTRKTRSRRS